MASLIKVLPKLKSDERGLAAVEYAVIAASLAVGILAAFTAFSGKISAAMNAISL